MIKSCLHISPEHWHFVVKWSDQTTRSRGAGSAEWREREVGGRWRWGGREGRRMREYQGE